VSKSAIAAALLFAGLLGGAVGGALVAIVDDGGTASGTVTVTSGGGGGDAAERVYAEAKDAVAYVTAEITSTQTSPFGPQQGAGQATGSGFVASADGAIVTNAHVVAGASAVQVKIGDQSVRNARIVGTDASTDIALLRVQGAVGARPLPFANSDEIVVGEPTFAIGNPFGLDRTLTTGVVSALQREITAPNGFSITGVVQTDAPINPGNSGGPLLNAAGQVIGVNSQILTGSSSSQGNVGIGFAVPSNTVRNVIEQLDRNGRVQHAYLGVQTTETATGAGARIAAVTAGGPAAEAGLAAGDVVVAFGGQQIQDPAGLSAAVNARRPGERVVVTVRRGGAERSVTVTLGQQPASSGAAATP
jgi:putative serine protease PepD